MSDPKKLYRSDDNKVLIGVCGGIGEYFNIDPVIIRVAAILITIFSGFIPGLIAYFVCAIVMPNKSTS